MVRLEVGRNGHIELLKRSLPGVVACENPLEMSILYEDHGGRSIVTTIEFAKTK